MVLKIYHKLSSSLSIVELINDYKESQLSATWQAVVVKANVPWAIVIIIKEKLEELAIKAIMIHYCGLAKSHQPEERFISCL